MEAEDRERRSRRRERQSEEEGRRGGENGRGRGRGGGGGGRGGGVCGVWGASHLIACVAAVACSPRPQPPATATR
eukprot:1041801-Rhodomonas_salina.1